MESNVQLLAQVFLTLRIMNTFYLSVAVNVGIKVRNFSSGFADIFKEISSLKKV
jgi:hypothetical protein